MQKLIVIVMVLFLTACTNSSDAEKALHGAGYKDIQITGYSWFSCSKDDTYSTGFTATGPTGVKVQGTVCSGMLFKNSTIRFN